MVETLLIHQELLNETEEEWMFEPNHLSLV
jgi:hypothetical protein